MGKMTWKRRGWGLLLWLALCVQFAGCMTSRAVVEGGDGAFVVADADRFSARVVIQADLPAAMAQAQVHSRFFGIPLSGRRVVAVIDRSGSMNAMDPSSAGVPGSRRVQMGLRIASMFSRQVRKRHSKMGMAKTELLGMLSQMPDFVRFNVRAFHHQDIGLFSNPRPVTRRSLGMAFRWVRSLRATGNTSLMDSLRAALQSQPDTIVLLSDGLPSRRSEIPAVLQMLRHAHQQTGVVVHVVGLGMKQDNSFLSSIARSTGGAYAIR